MDARDIVVLDREPHRRLDIALERQVHVAGRQHDAAVDRARRGEAQAQAGRPVADPAGLVDEAGGAARRRALDPHDRGRCRHPRSRACAWPCRRSSMPRRTRSRSSGVGRVRSSTSGCSLLIIMTRVPPARIGLSSRECSRPSTVQSTTMPQRGKRRDHRLEPADRERRAGRADRHRCGQLGRAQGHVERPRLELMQRKLGQPRQDRPRLRLRQDRHDLARLDRAQPEDLDERLDPLAFDRFLQHRPACSGYAPSARIGTVISPIRSKLSDMTSPACTGLDALAGARHDDIARIERVNRRGPRDLPRHVDDHFPRIGRLPHLAIDPQREIERPGIAQLVGGHQPRPEHRIRCPAICGSFDPPCHAPPCRARSHSRRRRSSASASDTKPVLRPMTTPSSAS